MVTKGKSPFRRGAGVLEKRVGSSEFISVGPDESIQIAPLTGMDEMLSADMHEFWEVNPFVSFPCLGNDCPGCATGNTPKFKAYLPVLTKEGQVKIYAFGIGVARQLSDIEEEIGSVSGKVFRIKRTGSGLKTKYQAIPVGKSVDVNGYSLPDIESKLGATDRERIVEILVENGLMEEPAEKKPVRKGKAVAEKEEKPKKKAAEKEAEDVSPWDDDEEETATEEDDSKWGDV